MFRLWAKIFKDTRLVRDTVVCNDDPQTSRTKKVFAALSDVCRSFDLSEPVWLDQTVNDFKRYGKARFTNDSFMEAIDFDYLEIHVIEED